MTQPTSSAGCATAATNADTTTSLTSSTMSRTAITSDGGVDIVGGVVVVGGGYTSSTSSSTNNNNNNKNSARVDDGEFESSTVENDENYVPSAIKLTVQSFPYLTITVYIPTVCVGLLIGKKGSTIDSIQKLAAKESTSVATAVLSSSQQQCRGKNSKQKVTSPESVRISVVNYPPPVHNHKNVNGVGGGGGHTSSSKGSPSTASIDMAGVPPTYTELDFTNPQWTPVVIRSDPIATMYAANAVNEICCPEYLPDRKHLVYIFDLPVPAVGGGGGGANINNTNGHASIVGKRGNTLVQLSADHHCRIMVPPKQLGHNIIQLEAPLQECCSCLEAIAAKLQVGNSNLNSTQIVTTTTTNSGNEQEKEQKNSGPKPSSSHSKHNTDTNKEKVNNKDNNFSITLVIQPLPSQTKLRNIGRKTETKILKKRMSKQQQLKHRQQQQQVEQEHIQSSKAFKDNGVNQEEHQQQEEQQESEESDTKDNLKDKTPESWQWRLTIVANSEEKTTKALDMLKSLNTKGYEVVVINSVIREANKDTCRNSGFNHSTGDPDGNNNNESISVTTNTTESVTKTKKIPSDSVDVSSTSVEEDNTTTTTIPPSGNPSNSNDENNKNNNTKTSTRGGRNKRNHRHHHKAGSGRGSGNNHKQQ